jgi:hypothetical protein
MRIVKKRNEDFVKRAKKALRNRMILKRKSSTWSLRASSREHTRPADRSRRQRFN